MLEVDWTRPPLPKLVSNVPLELYIASAPSATTGSPRLVPGTSAWPPTRMSPLVSTSTASAVAPSLAFGKPVVTTPPLPNVGSRRPEEQRQQYGYPAVSTEHPIRAHCALPDMGANPRRRLGVRHDPSSINVP